jgi:hypothetical protein
MRPFPDGTSSTAYLRTQHASKIQDADLTYENNLQRIFRGSG